MVTFAPAEYMIVRNNVAGSHSPDFESGKVSSDELWGYCHIYRGCWRITHLPTGMRLTDVSNERKAQRLCRALSHQGGWKDGSFSAAPDWAEQGSPMHTILLNALESL